MTASIFQMFNNFNVLISNIYIIYIKHHMKSIIIRNIIIRNGRLLDLQLQVQIISIDKSIINLLSNQGIFIFISNLESLV